MPKKRTAAKSRTPVKPRPEGPTAQEKSEGIRKRAEAIQVVYRQSAPFVIPEVHEAAVEALTRAIHMNEECASADIAFMRALKAAGLGRRLDRIESLGFAMSRAAQRAMAEAWIAAHGYAAIDAAYRR